MTVTRLLPVRGDPYFGAATRSVCGILAPRFFPRFGFCPPAEAG